MIYVKRRTPPFEAVCYNGDNQKDVLKFCDEVKKIDNKIYFCFGMEKCEIYVGDYIVREGDYNYVLYTPTQFNKLYTIYCETLEECNND